MRTTYTDVKVKEPGQFTHKDGEGFDYRANFPLTIISAAWRAGVSFEDLADGFGPGMGTAGGDWSGIRDSSREATDKMLERALNKMTFQK
jgi:aryl-alcohol dehydrogenase-like predicted oxidoreductase